MKDSKKFTIIFSLSLATMIFACAALVYVIDPFFHYHPPRDFFEYDLYDERYQNDGILRNFDYDTIITGSSVAESFSKVKADQLFEAKSVKVPLYGGTLREIGDQLKRAFRYNVGIKKVIFAFDLGGLIVDKDYVGYDDLPEYLYDSSLFDDINYLLNEDVVLYILGRLAGLTQASTGLDFDRYAMGSRWQEGETGADFILKNTYTRRPEVLGETPFDDSDRDRIKESLEQNVISTAERHPDTIFYIFFSPYSILFFDEAIRGGSFSEYFEGMEYASTLLLDCENIKLFSFFDNFNLICDLDNYRDTLHYSRQVNQNILEWISKDRYLLTKENYKERQNRISRFYRSYDYDSLFR